MAFQIGQDVVCIKADAWKSLVKHSPYGPAPKQIVRISGIDRIENIMARLYPMHAGPVEVLDVVFLEFVEFGKDYWFAANCFRPVRTTSIEIFRSALKPIEQLEPIKTLG